MSEDCQVYQSLSRLDRIGKWKCPFCWGDPDYRVRHCHSCMWVATGKAHVHRCDCGEMYAPPPDSSDLRPPTGTFNA